MVRERDDIERQLADQIHTLADASLRLGRTFAVGNDLHDTDFRALAFIHLNAIYGRDVSPAVLGSFLSLSSAAVTYLVDRLTRSGHVERMPDPQDGRRVILRYSDPGRELTGDFFARGEQLHRSALEDFSDAELATTSRVLASVLGGFAQYQAELSRAAGARDDDELEEATA